MKAAITKVIILPALVILMSIAGSTAAWAQTQCPTSPNYTPDFSSNQGCLTLNGMSYSAQSTTYPGFYPVVTTPPPPPGVTTVLRLTPNTTFTAGSAWFTAQESIAAGFSTTFTFQLSGGNTSDSPADGFAFVIQNSALTALGPEGCGIGYGGDSTGCTPVYGAQNGIPNSLVIEFDTYQNTDDPNNNHVAIQSCGTAPNSVDNLSDDALGVCDLGLNADLPITLADGNVHTVTIKYSGPSTTLLDVILDGTDLFPGGVSINLNTLLSLNNGSAWVGFTASTGGGDDNQDILSWSFSPQTQQGQPISPTSGLTQDFTFNNTTGTFLRGSFDYSTAQSSGELTIATGTTPYMSDSGITQADWASIVNGTTMADTSCLLAAGVTDANGNPLCAVTTQQCTTSEISTPAGENCPQSKVRNIIFSQTVDLFQPQTGGSGTNSWTVGSNMWTIPAGYAPGLAMGPDTLPTGQQCTFPSDSSDPLANQICPRSILTGLYDNTPKPPGGADGSNSSLIFFCCAPEWNTTPSIPLWSNSTTVPASFTSTPPSTPGGDSNNFHAAQGAFVTFGAEPRGAVLDTTLPLPAEQNVLNPTPCPTGTPATWAQQTPMTFTASGSMTSYDNNGTATPLTEGAFDAHFFSVDCDDFKELVYPPTVNVTPGIPSQYVNEATFKTVPFNIDLTAPTISPITLNPPGGYYAQNSSLTASFTCTDPVSNGVASGIKSCGPNTYPGPTGPSPVSPSVPLSTSTLGPATFTATAVDQAGNSSGPVSVSYTVVGPAGLVVGMVGNLVVKTGTNMTYYIGIANNGPNTADLVTLTDAIPAGTTFVSSAYAIESCTISGGQPSCSISPPTNSCGSVPGSCNIGALPAWTKKNPIGVLAQITVKVTASPGTTIKNVASVGEANSDPNSPNTPPWYTLVTK